MCTYAFMCACMLLSYVHACMHKLSLSHTHTQRKQIVHRAVNACIAPLCTMDGCSIVTVEGIGSTYTTMRESQYNDHLYVFLCVYTYVCMCRIVTVEGIGSTYTTMHES